MKNMNYVKTIFEKIVEMHKFKTINFFFNMYKMFKISAKTYEKNDVEVIVDDNGTLWRNEKHIEGKLGHKNLTVITNKYDPIYKKHIYELVDQPNNQPNRFFM